MVTAPFEQDGVDGFLHRGSGSGGLVLTHGAGGNATSPLLVTIADAFSAAGITVLRCNLAFRTKRPSGPPSGSGAADREGLRVAATVLRGMVEGPLYLGGQSYGGRQASMLAADQPDIADGLLLLSYPLHPPKQAERMRTDHFPRLRIPCVFVHGTKDPFATGQELEAAVRSIEAPTRILTIEGAGHDLKRGKFDPSPIVDALTRLAQPV